MGTESKRLLRPRYDPFQPIQEHRASCTQKVTPLDFRRAEFATSHGFREEALTHARHSAEGSTNVYHHSLKSELCRKGAAAHRDILEGGVSRLPLQQTYRKHVRNVHNNEWCCTEKKGIARRFARLNIYTQVNIYNAHVSLLAERQDFFG